MHPAVHQDKPGICSECGMNLIKSETSKEHDKPHFAKAPRGKHAGHKTESFLTKFWVSLALTIPIFFYSETASTIFNIQAPRFSGSAYALLALGSFVFFYCGWIFMASAYRELKARLPGMMTLIAIAITAAYTYSFFSIFSGTGHDLLFELSSLITVMLLGHWIEMRSVQSAQGALKELAKLLPDTAEVIRGNTTEIVPLSELKTGDVVLIKPGAQVPADGKIIEGRSDLNESIITGESRPVEKTVGATVIAGSLNGDGSLNVAIEKIGEHTFLAGVMRLVDDAQASKSRLQMVSDRAALYLTIIALVVGPVTFIAWLLANAGIVTATERLVAVLVITCPHALGLAVPLVASISTTMAARNGLLVRQRLALEAARNVDTVLFDKTGTLTEAKFSVTQSSSDEALALAASVNAHSEHPIAKAIVDEATKRSLPLQEASDFKRVPGSGAEGTVGSKHIFVGTKGGDDIVIEEDGMIIGKLSVADAVRPESKAAINRLKQAGIRVAMITGDSEQTAKRVAGELGLDEYFARVLPDQKVEKVRDLQAGGHNVAMVGDGVNDAPALAQANLGIAIGAGTNVAIESAGIILVKNDPQDIPKIFNLSRLTYRKMMQNLFWATGYNVVAIPLAAGVLASKGIVLEPALAAAFMSLSTVIVALNAVLLRNQKIG
ncbi:cadmium-translocating P-type ATPase [Candidatus Berkelbacteria bacterium]|nr:cadmium-translocating P-type ATPase [Candidatus Berkelbacteria bacterium]